MVDGVGVGGWVGETPDSYGKTDNSMPATQVFCHPANNPARLALMAWMNGRGSDFLRDMSGCHPIVVVVVVRHPRTSYVMSISIARSDRSSEPLTVHVQVLVVGRGWGWDLLHEAKQPNLAAMFVRESYFLRSSPRERPQAVPQRKKTEAPEMPVLSDSEMPIPLAGNPTTARGQHFCPSPRFLGGRGETCGPPPAAIPSTPQDNGRQFKEDKNQQKTCPRQQTFSSALRAPD
ncbi:hypothetical protein C0Q70_01216 [Pomacea canaliculata]|uniref:Uncharacterized protein n=1 Tax=Pomacea canaliculata TaxID=400727 RepID=A0A2T7PYX2_POMCA|nr:hypothetical protein C0Q70_01216 [Pomacea canaliculata]